MAPTRVAVEQVKTSCWRLLKMRAKPAVIESKTFAITAAAIDAVRVPYVSMLRRFFCCSRWPSLGTSFSTVVAGVIVWKLRYLRELFSLFRAPAVTAAQSDAARRFWRSILLLPLTAHRWLIFHTFFFFRDRTDPLRALAGSVLYATGIINDDATMAAINPELQNQLHRLKTHCCWRYCIISFSTLSDDDYDQEFHLPSQKSIRVGDLEGLSSRIIHSFSIVRITAGRTTERFEVHA